MRLVLVSYGCFPFRFNLLQVNLEDRVKRCLSERQVSQPVLAHPKVRWDVG